MSDKHNSSCSPITKNITTKAKDKLITLETILNTKDFKKQTKTHLTLYFFLKLLIGINYDSFFSLLIAYSSLYNLNKTQIGIVSNSYNIGSLVSSIFISYPKKYISTKKQIVLIATFCAFLTLLATALFEYLYFLIACRFVLGMLENYIYIYALDILVDFLPVKNRGFLLGIPYIGMQIGPIVVMIIVYITNPEFNPLMLKNSLIIISLIPLIIYIFYNKLIKESPESFINSDDAYLAKKRIYELNTDHSGYIEKKANDIEEYIQQLKIKYKNNFSIKDNIKNNNKSSFFNLFKSKYIKMSIACVGIKVFSTMLSRGLSIGIPFILKNNKDISNYKNLNSETNVNSNLLIQLIIGNITSILKPILCLSNDIAIFGRLGTLKITSLLASFFTLLMLFNTNNITVLSGLAFSFMGANSISIYNYVTECFPSELRIEALSLMTITSAIAAMITQVLYIYLSYYSVNFLIYFSCLIGLFDFAFCFLLDKEPMGLKID